MYKKIICLCQEKKKKKKKLRGDQRRQNTTTQPTVQLVHLTIIKNSTSQPATADIRFETARDTQLGFSVLFPHEKLGCILSDSTVLRKALGKIHDQSRLLVCFTIKPLQCYHQALGIS